MKIKVTLEYWGCWRSQDTHTYRINKLQGACALTFKRDVGQFTLRAGELIDEPDVNTMLASDVYDVTVMPKPQK